MKEEAIMGAGTIRRAITRADEDEVRARVARAGLGYTPSVAWSNDVLRIAQWRADDLVPPGLINGLVSVGIHRGRDGWEIEARRPLPKPWRWWESRSADLTFQFLAKIDTLRGCIAQAWPDEALIYRVPGAHGILAKWPATSIEAARERAEDECWARGLLVVEDAQQGPGVVDGEVQHTIACEVAGGDACDCADAPPHPRELEGARLGVDPLSPALALRRLAMRLQPGESVDVIDRLCNDFVTALRASLPAPPMPLPRSAAACSDCAALNAECLRLAEQVAALRLESEGNDAALLVATTERNAYRAEAEALRERAARTTDGALTAYLVEHHSDAWRPGEDALALTIRLLGELTADRNAFAAEARTANVTADRLATTAATLRRERDDAQADLATLRKGVSELAAKMGAPHG